MKNKRRFILFLTFIYFCFIPKGYAENCDSEYLKKLADNVEVHTEYDYESIDRGEPGVNIITVTGITDEIYAFTEDKTIGFYYEDIIDGSITKKTNDSTIESIDVYSKYCSNKKIKTIELSLKKYNAYSEFEECKGLEDKLDICSEIYDKNISYKELKKAIDKYKKEKNTGSNVNSFIDILKNNLIFIVIGVIVIIGIYIYYQNKKNKLD